MRENYEAMVEYFEQLPEDGYDRRRAVGRGAEPGVVKASAGGSMQSRAGPIDEKAANFAARLRRVAGNFVLFGCIGHRLDKLPGNMKQR